MRFSRAGGCALAHTLAIFRMLGNPCLIREGGDCIVTDITSRKGIWSFPISILLDKGVSKAQFTLKR